MSAREDLSALVPTIYSSEIRQFTEDILDAAPETFWTAKASKNHHPYDERAAEGNVIHSIRVTNLVRIMAQGCQMEQVEADILTSAAILHDVGRYGVLGDAEFTVQDHPQLVRTVARIKGIDCQYADDIFTLIEKHMGIWGEPLYTPEVTPSALLHLADVVSANADKVWGGEKMEDTVWVGDVPFKEIGMTGDKMELLKELAEDNDYWKSAHRFVRQSSSRKLSSLTTKQRDWLENICDSLAVELNKKAAEETYEG